ncbi:MAG: flagellar hook-basal body complex protein [Candidatus Omnitrophota bacterium]
MTVNSLYVGLSGLNAMSHDIDVIGNNIANVNTTGFRASRATFDDIFYQSLFYGTGNTGTRGGINPRQIGKGVKLGSVDTIFTQGSTQTTGRLLDLAIEGKGFFVVKSASNQQYLTRAGNFSLDNTGRIVDAGTGYRLQGWTSNSQGVLNTGGSPSDLSIDYAKESKAKATENVTAGGNFDARIGETDSGVDVLKASKTTNLLGLFDADGNSFGLVNGDEIKIETGFLKLADPPTTNTDPIDLTQAEIFSGKKGVIMTVTSTTTIDDLKSAIQNYLDQAVADRKTGAESDIEVTYDADTGNFLFSNRGSNEIMGMRVGLAARGNDSEPPKTTNQRMGELFINQGDPNFTKTLDIKANESVSTNTLRQADVTTSIEVYDSQGDSHTVSVGLTADTEKPGADGDSLLSELKDNEGRFLIPGGIVPAQIEYSDPVLDPKTNTAVYTATQVSNIVATQGVFTFLDGETNPNLIAIRLSDGFLSINGNEFVDPKGTASAEVTQAGLDVTDSSYLNVPSETNLGGLMGNSGFSETTTLEDIRKNIEERLNKTISQVANNIDKINAGSTTLPIGTSATGFTVPATTPKIEVKIAEDGSISFKAIGGSLGASASTDATINSNLATNAGGADKLGLMFDLAAKTRSVRISTVDRQTAAGGGTTLFKDGEVDDDVTDGGGVSGFVKTADPFATDLFAANSIAFTVGNTDFDSTTAVTGDPTLATPTGVDDSGVRLIALSSGKFGTTTTLTTEKFSGKEAFTAQSTAFRALFNQKGYGIAADADGDNSLDRIGSIPNGIVALKDAPAFETNAVKIEKQMQNTVNYQIVTPNDYRSEPTGTTGSLIFDSLGDFSHYDSGATPTVAFDPDNSDPQFYGVNKIMFTLDMSNITQNSGSSTAELSSQDGRAMGTLDNVSIGVDGKIWGSFTNGDVQTMGQIALGDVINEGGLIQEGSSYFSAGPNSGPIDTNLQAGITGGTINSGTLELSNVDLAREFTDLIVAQRAYQADTRVITTGDQILQEVVNLKR